ncbi:hypothetical protein HanRHA438_Chr09g0401841 [Helianthus annuus]|nr:hypothetical protein HanRHA438_Chr09g0401841 [Helianthus annuus]
MYHILNVYLNLESCTVCVKVVTNVQFNNHIPCVQTVKNAQCNTTSIIMNDLYYKSNHLIV